MASEGRGSVLTEEKRLWKYITHLHKYPQAKLSHTFSTQLISLAVKHILQQDMTFLFVSYVYWYVHSQSTHAATSHC